MPGSTQNKRDNSAAMIDAGDANAAMIESDRNVTRFGYQSLDVILQCRDLGELKEKLNYIEKNINARGLKARIEKMNAFEAYLGSIPGNRFTNQRVPLLSTKNYAHTMNVSSPWLGSQFNPNPNLPKKSSPLFLATCSGMKQFRFVNHVEDVGHTLVLGPTGAGKSTLLNLIVAQAHRYENAQVFIFEKGLSAYATTTALGGDYYSPLKDKTLAFAPLKTLETQEDRIWASEWLMNLIKLQGVEVNSAKRKLLDDGLNRLTKSPHRSLSHLALNVQNKELRDALAPFLKAQKGVMGNVMDAEEDGLQNVNKSTLGFDISALLQQQPRIAAPLLTHLFRWVERRLDGRPSTIILDEAWVMLSHELFREQIIDWLRTLRKKNCYVIFATQSVSDIADSPIKNILLESCPTKIFLPNPEALTEVGRVFYKNIGLNDTQINTIARAQSKAEYYLVSKVGKRLINLELSKSELAIIGASSPEDVKQVKSLQQKSKSGEWVAGMLKYKGCDNEAQEYLELIAENN